MRLTETCRCGGNFTAEAEGDTAAGYLDGHLATWRTAHRCVPDAIDDRRSGVGFAATQSTSRLHAPWGHNTQEVRA